MNIESHIENSIKKLNFFLEQYIKENKSGLTDAMEYTLMAKGKKIRPLLMIFFYELFGGKDEEIYKFAAAIEMIHTYSLIHDDLPCMDDGKMRRGKKCSHIVFGEDVALLAGDALLTGAFEVASGSNLKNSQKCINILASLAGTSGMVLGQYKDLKGEGSLMEIHKLKTANLFISCAKIGAILAGANEKELEICEEIGLKMGLCFQIVDDLDDGDIRLSDIMCGEKVVDLILRLSNEVKKRFENLSGDTCLLEHIFDLILSKISY